MLLQLLLTRIKSQRLCLGLPRANIFLNLFDSYLNASIVHVGSLEECYMVAYINFDLKQFIR